MNFNRIIDVIDISFIDRIFLSINRNIFTNRFLYKIFQLIVILSIEENINL